MENFCPGYASCAALSGIFEIPLRCLYTARCGYLYNAPQWYGDDLTKDIKGGINDIVKKAIIITDSSCDLPDEVINRYPIRVMPMAVSVKDNPGMDISNLTLKEFYDMMR